MNKLIRHSVLAKKSALAKKSTPFLKSFLFCPALLLFAACNEQYAEVGKIAPELAAFDLQGNAITLAQGRGQKQLISFWSQTCGACLAELRTLQQWQQRFPEQIRLLAINIDGEKSPQDELEALLDKRQINLPIIKDQLQITAERYHLIGTPTSFVIDNEGKLQQRISGLISEPQLHQLFNASARQ